MNFKPKAVERTEPPVLNMKQLAQALDYEAAAVNQVAFAPPAIRNATAPEAAIAQVKAFAELITKELDDMVTAGEAELAALKADCQAVRDIYVKHTTRITSDMERLREGVRLSVKTVKLLHEQILRLDNPPLEPPKPEPEKEVGNDRSPG